MSLMLSSATVTSQPVNPASHAPARSEEAGENKAGSFSEALSRSLEPAAEAAEKTASKTATAKLARRPADADKGEPVDLVSTMVLALMPAEISAGKTPAGTEAAVSTAATTAAAPATAAPTAAAPAAAPIVAATAAPTAAAPTAAAAAAPAVAAAPMAAVLVPVPVAIPAAAEAAMAATQAKPESALPPAQQPALTTLAAVSQQDAVSATPARPDAPGARFAQLPDAGKIALPASAPGTDASDQAAQGEASDADPEHLLRAESADRTAVVRANASTGVGASTSQAGSIPSSVGVDSAAAASVSSANQQPAAEPSGASAAWLVNPATAAAPGLTHLATPDLQAAVPVPVLSSEVGSSEWGKALGQQMIHMGTQGQQTAELQLNPPGLGPLKVTLSLNDQQIQALFVSAHPSVRAAVEAALPQLRTALADHGISLGGTSVSAESQPQAAFDDRQNRQSGQSAYRSASQMDPAATTPVPLAAGVRQRHGVTVDTYA